MNKVKLACQYIFCLFVLALQLQCNNAKDVNAENLSENIDKSHKITSEDISQIKYTEYVLSNQVEEKTKDWQKFQNLQDHIEVLKKGDISFFKDDKAILQSFITDLKNEIPESLNAPSIIVRLTVLETTLFKLDEILNLQSMAKQSILDNIKDVLIAHNNLILQINKKVEKDSQKIVKP
jgi:hypothetical protein